MISNISKPKEEQTMNTNFKFWGKLTAIFAIMTFIATIPQAPGVSAADSVVKVGNIIPLSGPSASVGEQGKNAREMAVEEINAAGGIKSLGGAKLEMIYDDYESKQ